MRIKKFLTPSLNSLLKLGVCLAVQANLSLLSPAAQAADEQNYEITSLQSLSPYISKWRAAINKKNVARAQTAAEQYEAIWQGVEVYINHRSLALYRDMEIDTQFAIEDELEKANPDFNLMKQQIAHLEKDLRASIQMAKAGPKLSALFDDLVPLRTLRGKTLPVIRDALSETTPDIAKAKAAFAEFKQGFPEVSGLIEFRSSEAVADINAAIAAADLVFSDANATAAQLLAANTALTSAYGYGVNLLNAAARTSLLTKTAISSTDKTNLTQLNKIRLALASHSAAAGDTGPSSTFATIQTALEGLGRNLNAVGTLRTALLAYDKAVQASPADAAAIAKAQKAALQAVAITEQALVGQFWGTPDLTAFLASLPTS